MDPITIGLIAAGAGTAMTVVSDLREGQTAAAGAKYNASVAEQEAAAINQNAALQEQQLAVKGKSEQAKLSREKVQTISEQRARYAKSGVVIEAGSPLEVMGDTAAQYELDLATSKYNTDLNIESTRYNARVGASRSLSEAAYQNLLAKEYKTASYLKAGSTLLTGFGNMASMSGGGK